MRPARERVLEGEEVELELDVRASAPAELYFQLPRELELVDGANPFAVDGDEVVTLRVRATRWGAYLPGLVSSARTTASASSAGRRSWIGVRR